MRKIILSLIIFLVLAGYANAVWWDDAYSSRISFNFTHPTIDMNYTFQKVNLSIGYVIGERLVT